MVHSQLLLVSHVRRPHLFVVLKVSFFRFLSVKLAVTPSTPGTNADNNEECGDFLSCTDSQVMVKAEQNHPPPRP